MLPSAIASSTPVTVTNLGVSQLLVANTTVEGDTVTEETADADTKEEVASGIAEAGQELREILDEMADDVEVLVRIEAGTPIGVLFVEPVTTDEDI